MIIPFGRRRVVLTLDRLPAPPARPVPAILDVPASHGATDRELARLNRRAEAAEDRLRWETTALLYGFRPF